MSGVVAGRLIIAAAALLAFVSGTSASAAEKAQHGKHATSHSTRHSPPQSGAFIAGTSTLGSGGFASPRAGCPSPNPNSSGPPFMDGCPLPAAGLNHAMSSLSGGLSGSLPGPALAPSGVTAGSYTIGSSCLTVAVTGQVTSIASGACGGGGGGAPLNSYVGGTLGSYGGGSLGYY